MRGHFIGTADGFTSVRRDHSGILLELAGTTLLLDCGGTVGQYLRREKLGSEVPEVFWISHMHSDHTGQISSLIQSLWLRQRQAPLHIYGPGPVLDDLKSWLAKSLLFPELLAFPIHWHAVKPGQTHTHGPFTLTAFPTEHLSNLASRFQRDYPGTCFECYGLVLECEGQRYVYSADIAHPRELVPILKGTPVKALICELAHFPERELFQELAPFEVESIWLTHYGDHYFHREAELRSVAAEEKFKGTVHLLKDRVAYDL